MFAPPPFPSSFRDYMSPESVCKVKYSAWTSSIDIGEGIEIRIRAASETGAKILKKIVVAIGKRRGVDLG
jgi:hypothetical protein